MRASASAPQRSRIATWTLSIENRFDRAAYEIIKRAMDLVVAVPLSMLCAPILLICAIWIKLDSQGPVFFRQLRTGKGGNKFNVWKLRTMVVNADELKEQVRQLSELTWPDFKADIDPRVTRVGKFLRKTSLDELPQLINVLRGDMSLVGPRPTSFATSEYQLWHTARLRVTPGITGLAQVLQRQHLQFDDRSRLDIAYIQHRSLWLDIQILYRTAILVMTRKDGI